MEALKQQLIVARERHLKLVKQVEAEIERLNLESDSMEQLLNGLEEQHLFIEQVSDVEQVPVVKETPKIRCKTSIKKLGDEIVADIMNH